MLQAAAIQLPDGDNDKEGAAAIEVKLAEPAEAGLAIAPLDVALPAQEPCQVLADRCLRSAGVSAAP